MKKLYLLLALFPFLKAQAQVSDASQLLKIKNITNSSSLNAISSPTRGNLAFLQSNKKVYKYTGSSWTPIVSSISNTNFIEAKISDDDGDTRVHVDEGIGGFDYDIVKFVTKNVHSFTFKQSKIEFLNSDGIINLTSQTGSSLTPGLGDIFIGYKTANHTISDGQHNIAIGSSALTNYLNAYGNIAIGTQAMLKNKSGDLNLAVGANALKEQNSNSEEDYNTVIGAKALERCTSCKEQVAVGYNALSNFNNASSVPNVALGYQALRTLTAGGNNVGIGYNANVGTNVSNRVRIGNNAVQYAYTYNSWFITSDSTFKRDIQPLKFGLDLITKMEPVDYIRKTEGQTEEMGREMGFIAQDLVKVLKEIGYENQGFITKERGHYSVRYNDFIPLTIQGIKEQQNIIHTLKNENTQLQLEAQAQDRVIDKLKTQLRDEISSIKSEINKINN